MNANIVGACGAQCLTAAILKIVAKAAQAQAEALYRFVAVAAQGRARAFERIAMAAQRQARAYVEAAQAQARTFVQAAGGGDPAHRDICGRIARCGLRTVTLEYV